MNRNKLLGIFIKAPEAGQVKTRLQPKLTVEESRQLYMAMVEDLTGRFIKPPFDVKIFYWPPDALSQMQLWLGEHWDFSPQIGKDLGEKIHRAFVQAFHSGYKKVVIIGSDLPTLDSMAISIAFAKLESNDVVLGPATDGGYYLIGLKKPHSELFQGMVWSSDSVLGDTIKKANQKKLSIYQLELKMDVDTYPNILQLWNELKQIKEQKKGISVPRTYRVLNEMFSKPEVASSLKLSRSHED